MKKIAVFTGGRAEYGILYPLLKEIKNDKRMELQLIASAMHLSREFGLTYKVIEADGFNCADKIETVLSSDTPISICKSMGLGLISLAETLERLKPDALLVLGDRYETFTASVAALISRIPLIHLQGGEVTKGAVDDQLRHSITKMANFHFAFTEKYRNRIIQLGENRKNVFNYGALNVDSARKVKKISRSELSDSLGHEVSRSTILVTFHPSTLEKDSGEKQFPILLNALKKLKNFDFFFTKTNADTEGRVINEMIDDFVKNNKQRASASTSLGQLRYINFLRHAGCMIGNSSSGIIETANFKLPTVNIGDRQEGRVRSANVIDCETNSKDIERALKKALDPNFRIQLKKIKDLHFKPNTAVKIKNKIFELKKPNNTKKDFFDIK